MHQYFRDYIRECLVHTSQEIDFVQDWNLYSDADCHFCHCYTLNIVPVAGVLPADGAGKRIRYRSDHNLEVKEGGEL